MKSPPPFRLKSRAECVAARSIEVTADTEVRRGKPGYKPGHRVEFADRCTAHQGEHPAEERPRGLPSKTIDCHYPANLARGSSRACEPGRTAQVVNHERQIFQLEAFDQAVHGAGG